MKAFLICLAIAIGIVMLVGCSTVHEQVAQICDESGWDSGKCAYVSAAALEQQRQQAASSRQMLRSGTRLLTTPSYTYDPWRYGW